jgi:hypothetical protein
VIRKILHILPRAILHILLNCELTGHSGVRKVRKKQDGQDKRGKVYDLEEIMGQVRERYFDEGYAPTIGWASGRRGRRSITFGSYNRARHHIRINPRLDQAEIPRYFIEFVVYHEMLHGVCEIENRRGRRVIHTAEFRQKERLFEHYEAATEYQRSRSWQDIVNGPTSNIGKKDRIKKRASFFLGS